MFTIDNPTGHQTHGGQKARIICSDVKNINGYSILALIDVNGYEKCYAYTSSGSFYNDSNSEFDLINCSLKKCTVEELVNDLYTDFINYDLTIKDMLIAAIKRTLAGECE